MSILNSQSGTNERILEGIRSQDEQVIQMLYKDLLPGIVTMVQKNSGHIEDAEDVFHDGLIVFYRKVREDDFKATSSLSTYLFAICKNIWLKKLKRKSIHQKVTNLKSREYSNENTLEFKMEKEDRFDLYKEKFALLSPSCQKCLKLFFQGKSMEEIAEALKLSGEGSARKKKFKCKEKLIDLIKSDTRYDELTD